MSSCPVGAARPALSVVLGVAALIGTSTVACIDVPLATPTMDIEVRRTCEAELCFKGYTTNASVTGDWCAIAFDVSGLSCVTSIEGITINDASTGMPVAGWGEWVSEPRVGAGFDRVAEKLGEFGTAFAGFNTQTIGDIAAGVDIEICVQVATSIACTPGDLETELMAAGYLFGAADSNEDGELGDSVSIEPIAGVDLIEFDSCPEDIDGSGSIDIGDILAVLTGWGPCADFCTADLDCSGSIGFEEIVAILPAWGPCP